MGNANRPAQKTSARNMIVGNACILIATIFWGINIPVTKDLVPDWMSANAVTVLRLCCGGALIWIASLFARQEHIDRSDWLKLIIGGAVGLFSFLALFNMSLAYASPIDVSIVMTLPPVEVILFGVIFRHGRPSWLEWIGLVASLAGAAIVILAQSGAKGSDNTLGLLLALASTIGYSAYLIIFEKPSQKYQPMTTLRWAFLFAAIPALLFVPDFLHAPLFHGTATTASPWIEAGFVLVCSTFLAYLLIMPADRLIGSELVSIYQCLLPVIAAVASVLMGIEQIKGRQIIAMAIIIAGLVLINVGKMRRTRAAAPQPSGK